MNNFIILFIVKWMVIFHLLSGGLSLLIFTAKNTFEFIIYTLSCVSLSAIFIFIWKKFILDRTKFYE
jgi:predicted secreted protein